MEQLQATLSSAISKESHEKLQQELDAALANLQLKKDECEKLMLDQTKEKIAQDEEEAKEVQRLNDALKTQNTLIDNLRENLNDNEKGLATRAIPICFCFFLVKKSLIHALYDDPLSVGNTIVLSSSSSSNSLISLSDLKCPFKLFRCPQPCRGR